MQEHPELWQHAGNLAVHAQEAMLQLITKNNLYLAESAARFARMQREELAGPNATLLEKLTIERIIATNMMVCFFESEIGQQEGTDVSLKYKEYLHSRLDQCTRRLTGALTSLAQIRRLLPYTLKVELAVSGEVTANVSNRDTREVNDGQPLPPETLHNRVRDYVGAESTN